MRALSAEFKANYNSFVSDNTDLAKAKCLPGAGWGTAKKIKRAGDDKAVVNKLFNEMKNGTVTAKELRWFTPKQLESLKDKITTEYKDKPESLKVFVKVFGEAFVISHKRHHSESKQQALLKAYQTIKNIVEPRVVKEGVDKKEPGIAGKPAEASPRVVTDKTREQGNPTSFKAKQQMLLNTGIGGQKAAGVPPKKPTVKVEEPKQQAISTTPPKTHSEPAEVAGGPPPPPPPVPNAAMLRDAAKRARDAKKEDAPTADTSTKAKPKVMKESDKAGQVGSMAEKAAQQAREREERAAAREAKKNEGK
ncbi:MAG: hypothetical protein JSR37_07280 [Verrucomicrobia bacterium]|nr:hypothetical protein [Verrucomicrobiota bacterium]MBS0638209.1 hypothetical protein [Verrucomicrobiota bacterium]